MPIERALMSVRPRQDATPACQARRLAQDRQRFVQRLGVGVVEDEDLGPHAGWARVEIRRRRADDLHADFERVSGSACPGRRTVMMPTPATVSRQPAIVRQPSGSPEMVTPASTPNTGISSV